MVVSSTASAIFAPRTPSSTARRLREIHAQQTLPHARRVATAIHASPVVRAPAKPRFGRDATRCAWLRFPSRRALAVVVAELCDAARTARPARCSRAFGSRVTCWARASTPIFHGLYHSASTATPARRNPSLSARRRRARRRARRSTRPRPIRSESTPIRVSRTRPWLSSTRYFCTHRSQGLNRRFRGT
ncbi:hypothetical protein EXIGLDRAFT_114120 [Exidia glandulosa HHB12029]|uniref:Uncharacterized protein n=1 Tax=Exidia glandulosa HHB12029 TaxID=1314781 RepID=A0A166ACX4_EXIGL|nr:hypothetical protein EXIGLDRAFT_114120 [Exidia glandulosa HHB12029]